MMKKGYAGKNMPVPYSHQTGMQSVSHGRYDPPYGGKSSSGKSNPKGSSTRNDYNTSMQG